jgi:hypothetical protein
VIDAASMAEILQFIGTMIPMCTLLVILYIIVYIRNRTMKQVRARKVRVRE